MILEVAPLHVRSGQAGEFEAAFQQAQAIIASMPGYIAHELQRCIEREHEYLLLVRWQTLRDHEVGFRQSAPYQEWKRLLHRFYEPFPRVSHYEPVQPRLPAGEALPGAFIELRSPRLRLRRLDAGDVDALCAYRSLPEVARFQSWESFGVEDAARLVAGQAQLPLDTPGTWFQLGIVGESSGLLVGDCGLHFDGEDPGQVELGITLSPDQQGQGYATEALACVLDYLFGVLGKRRVSAVTDADNAAAAALFRRLHFRQEGHFVEHARFKGAYGSEYLFALLRREWQGT